MVDNKSVSAEVKESKPGQVRPPRGSDEYLQRLGAPQCIIEEMHKWEKTEHQGN